MATAYVSGKEATTMENTVQEVKNSKLTKVKNMAAAAITTFGGALFHQALSLADNDGAQIVASAGAFLAVCGAGALIYMNQDSKMCQRFKHSLENAPESTLKAVHRFNKARRATYMDNGEVKHLSPMDIMRATFKVKDK